MNKREFWAVFWAVVVTTSVCVIGAYSWWFFTECVVIDAGFKGMGLAEFAVPRLKKFGPPLIGAVSLIAYLITRFRCYDVYKPMDETRV